ncbi:MAG: mechanosensitive ion channel family protein [Burkholderiales bacterium]|nr:mechanosensitive ion channel family protein [Burkholderiales bacterium]
MKQLAATFQQMEPAALTTVRIALILVAAWIASVLLRRLIRVFRQRVTLRLPDSEAIKRAETLSQVFRYTANVVLLLIAGMLILSEVGVSVAPILGAAGVVGIALGFGAQSLVKDYFTGFFILLENQIRQGDVVEIAGKSGLVEQVTLRFVRLRDYEGSVHYIPNGLINTVTNKSRGFAHAVIDIGIAYGDDIDTAFEIMRRVGAEMRTDPAFAPRILADFELAGVEKLADSAVMLRGRMKVAPLEQANVRREYLRRIKAAFTEAGIQIPYPHLTVYAGKERNENAERKQETSQ